MSSAGVAGAGTPGRGIPAQADLVTPESPAEAADVLREASREGMRVGIWGGGTHRDMGNQGEYDLVVSTGHMSGMMDWQPEDLTVVVRAGTPVEELEADLNGGGQSAVLPEQPGRATVGGVVATATSPYARLRYGPTRDRVLEVQAVTGDGRVVKGGGRVVKNVTGYDLPRLYTGSFGSLGVIASVCLKLWPLTEANRTVVLGEVPPEGTVYRPRAVLQTESEIRVLLSGTGREVDDQVRRLGGDAGDGMQYPRPLVGDTVWSVRVPAGRVSSAIERLPEGSRFIAQHGVGEVAFEADASFDIADLRGWAEAEGGSVVRLRGPSGADPWGTPPPALDLQRRVISAFDPARVLEPGRLPGGL